MSKNNLKMIDTSRDKSNGKELEIFYLTWPNLYRMVNNSNKKNKPDEKISTN